MTNELVQHYNVRKDIFDHVEDLSIIIGITRGNFHLIERILAQMKHFMKVNNISDISGGDIEAARECLVIGVESDMHF